MIILVYCDATLTYINKNLGEQTRHFDIHFIHPLKLLYKFNNTAIIGNLIEIKWWVCSSVSKYSSNTKN